MEQIILAAAETSSEAIEGVFTAASHNDVLKLLIEIVILLFTARFFGEIAQRMGQSSVVGEILAGILLGPSFLSGLIPIIEEWIVPETTVQGYLLEDISLLGIIFLLLITGLETDLSLIKRQARSAIGVAIGGLSVTLTVGFLLGTMLPDDLLVSPDDRTVFALFLAISMAISAIPVIAKVLMDLNLTRRDAGQNIIASAMIDDTTGWILLSVVIGLAEGGGFTIAGVAESVFSVLAFLIISFTAGQWIVGRSLRFVQNQVISRDKVLTLVVLLTFTWGAITHALHLEALLGAFVMGILLSRLPSLDDEVIHKLESIALGIFAPIFFATAGLKVDIITLLEPRLLAFTALITIVAIICKVTGVYLGARYIGKRDHWTAMFLGVGLNARGSMGIIVATIGLQVGVLTQETFSMIVLMAVITSLIAPAALRWTLQHIEQGDQEKARLHKESLQADDLIANTHRVLLPVRPRQEYFSNTNQIVEAQILDRIGKRSELAITLFTITNQDDDESGAAFLNRISDLFPNMSLTRRATRSNGHEPANLILDEARKDYDLLVLGATTRHPDSEALFNPVVDQLMRLAPCPTMVVKGREVGEHWEPRRILVPTNGARPAKRAAQIAFSLAEEEVIALSVVERRYLENYQNDEDERWQQRQINISEQIVMELGNIGTAMGIKTSTQVKRGKDTASTILNVARAEQVDLIIVGTNVRAGSDRLYLGPKVERILNEAPCPVIVINMDE